MAATTDIAEALKYTYGAENLKYLANQESVLYRHLQKKQQEIGGRAGQFIIPFTTKNAGVWRGISQGGSLSTRRPQPASAEMTFSLQEFHGAFDVTFKLLQDMRKSEYAFERGLTFMEDAQRRRVFRLMNADFLGKGRGELAILPAADDQVTITINSLPLCEPGMYVDVMDASDDDTKLEDSATVDAIDIKNRTITLSGAPAGTAANDYLTVEDSVASATGSLHMLGILAWLDDANPVTVVGNIGGINRSTAGNEWAQANVLENSGTNRPLTEDLLIEGNDLTRERGGAQIDAYFSNLKIIRRYHAELREDVFFALGQVKGFDSAVGIGRDESQMQQGEDSMGETIYRFGGVPWYAEPYFWANTLIGIRKEHFFIGHGENEMPAPLSEIFNDMVSFFTFGGTTATFDVHSYWQGELLCDNPMAGTKFEDIAES